LKKTISGSSLFFVFLSYILFLTERGMIKFLIAQSILLAILFYSIRKPFFPFYRFSLAYLTVGSDEFNNIFRLISLGLGGWKGSEIGIQAFERSFLKGNPDFIFSYIGSHMGFMGTGFIILIYFLLIYFCLRISLTVRRHPSFYLSMVMTFYLFNQIVMHIAWATQVWLDKGAGLPLIDHRPPIILFMIALGFIVSFGQKKGPTMLREINTVVISKKRISFVIAFIIITFALLLMRVFQYQVLNREWHLEAYKCLSAILPEPMEYF
jgi:cell division protein FtsW (lipid II flippase)